jgi:hypothetical protein
MAVSSLPTSTGVRPEIEGSGGIPYWSNEICQLVPCTVHQRRLRPHFHHVGLIWLRIPDDCDRHFDLIATDAASIGTRCSIARHMSGRFRWSVPHPRRSRVSLVKQMLSFVTFSQHATGAGGTAPLNRHTGGANHRLAFADHVLEPRISNNCGYRQKSGQEIQLLQLSVSHFSSTFPLNSHTTRSPLEPSWRWIE